MNNRHTNIKFNNEAKKNNQLAFLDINIKRHAESFLTGTYRKPTFNGICTNYNSLIPSEYKIGLVNILLELCFQITSSYKIVYKEIEKLKTIMIKNAYPRPFLDKVIKYFLDKRFNVKPVCDTANKYKARITLPYLGKTSEVLRTQLKDLFKKMPCCSIQMVFTTNCRIGNFFRFKDKLPSSLRSKIVYFFKCSRCNSTYVRVTKRHGN